MKKPAIISVIPLTVLLLLTQVSLAFAETVYITKRGLRFYPKDCIEIKDKEHKSIELKKAILRGMTPSEICYSTKDLKKYEDKVKVEKEKAKTIKPTPDEIIKD